MIAVDEVELGQNTVELGWVWLNWGQRGGIGVDAVGLRWAWLN